LYHNCPVADLEILWSLGEHRRYTSTTNISIGDNCDNFGTKITVRDTIKYENGNTMEIVSLEH
jgi:hypothetical protein